MPRSGPAVDLTDKKFGDLLVLGFAGKQGKNFMWLAQCKCGKRPIMNGETLRSGRAKSCGCKACCRFKKEVWNPCEDLESYL